MRPYRARPFHLIVAAVVSFLLMLITANAFVLVKIANTLDALPSRETDKSLPCPAIPTRLILEDPACAQKLLDVMNVTNVQVRLQSAAGLKPENLTETRNPRNVSKNIGP